MCVFNVCFYSLNKLKFSVLGSYAQRYNCGSRLIWLDLTNKLFWWFELLFCSLHLCLWAYPKWRIKNLYFYRTHSPIPKQFYVYQRIYTIVNSFFKRKSKLWCPNHLKNTRKIPLILLFNSLYWNFQFGRHWTLPPEKRKKNQQNRRRNNLFKSTIHHHC